MSWTKLKITIITNHRKPLNHENSMIFSMPTDEKEALSYLSQLGRASPRDQMKYQAPSLTKCAHIISPLLTHMINSHCIFPSRLKVAKIIPIPKKTSTQEREKYRPIAITSSFSKVQSHLQLPTWLSKRKVQHHSNFQPA